MPVIKIRGVIKIRKADKMKSEKKYPQFYADADINLREIADHKLNGMSYISYVDVYKNSSYPPHWH